MTWIDQDLRVLSQKHISRELRVFGEKFCNNIFICVKKFDISQPCPKHKSQAHTIEMKLTGCSWNEFTCDDSQCVRIDQRCNQLSNCKFLNRWLQQKSASNNFGGHSASFNFACQSECLNKTCQWCCSRKKITP